MHTVTLTVRDDKTAAPIGGATVLLQGRVHTTDVHGHVELTDIGVIEVSSPEYQPHSLEVTAAMFDGNGVTVYLRPIDVVVVIADLPHNGAQVTSLTRERITDVPGALGDPARALETLPSVARMKPGDPGLVVRGAEGTHTPVRIDGIEVPWLYHWYFLRSVVDPSRLSDLTIRPGGLPASDGGFVQGLVDVSTIDRANAPGFHGHASLDLLDGGLSGTFGAGRWDILASGRLSWGGELLGLGSLIASRGSAYVPARFSDYSLRTTGDFNSLQIQFTALGAADALRFYDRNDAESDDQLPYDPSRVLDRQFHRVQLRVRSRSPWGTTDSWMLGGLDLDRSLLDENLPFLDTAPGPTYGELKSYRVAGRSQIRVRLPRGWWFDGGFDGDLQYADSKPYGQTDTSTGEPPVYREYLATASPWVALEGGTPNWWWSLGTRSSVHVIGGSATFVLEPRAALRWTPDARVSLDGFLGGTSQRPAAWQTSPAFHGSTLDPVRSWQAVLGGTCHFGGGFEVDVHTYGTWFPSVVISSNTVALERRPADSAHLTLDVAPAWQNVGGLAVGGELMGEWTAPNERGSVALAATVGRSLRWSDEGVFAADRDQLLRASAWARWEPGRRWTLSARYQVGSGLPATAVTPVSDPRTGFVTGIPSVPNGTRHSFTYQLDLRVAKTFAGRTAIWTVFLDVFNVTAQPISLVETVNPITQEVEPILWVPVIPNMGLEVTF